MLVNVWLVHKRGEPRIYTWTFLPTEDQLAIFRKDGFKIFRAEIELPVDEDTDVITAYAQMVHSAREREDPVPDLTIIHHDR